MFRAFWYSTLILIFSLNLVEGGKYEDFKEAAEIFKESVEMPLTGQIRQLGRVARKSLKFAEGIGPLGKVVASSAKLIFDDDKLEEVYELSKNIFRDISTMRDRQEQIFSETTFKDASNDYKEKITKPIRLHSRLAHYIINSTSPITDGEWRNFEDMCLNKDGPFAIAYEIREIIKACGEPTLDYTVLSKVYKSIDSLKIPTSAEGIDLLVSSVYNVLMYYGDEEREKRLMSFEKLKDTSIQPKIDAVLLFLRKNQAKDDKNPISSGECLPKEIFKRSGYKRWTMLYFGMIMENHYLTTLLLAKTCSTFTTTDKAKELAYMEPIYEELKGAPDFFENWFVNLLDSTWPTFENVLVQRSITSFTNGIWLVADTPHCSKLLSHLQDTMKGVGNSNYLYQYIVTAAWYDISLPWWKDTFYAIEYNCTANICTYTSGQGFHVFRIRTLFNTSQAYVDERRAQSFIELKGSNFTAGLEKGLNRYKCTSLIIRRFKEEYNLDFNKFENHQFFLFMRSFSFISPCDNSRSVAGFKTDEHIFIKNATYFGSFLTELGIYKCFNYELYLV